MLKNIKFILFTILLTTSLHSQELDYMKMIDIEIGSSLKDVKNLWESSELNQYSMLKAENILVREKHGFLLYRDTNDEFTFMCNYQFIEDSLFSIILTNYLTLNEANTYVRLIKDKFDISIDEGSWKVESFDTIKPNKYGSTNSISFGIEPRKDKIKFSISITNLRQANKRKTFFEEFTTQNDSLNGFFDIKWESSKDEVIKRMKLYEGVELDSINDYRVDFIGGEFGRVKVKKWVFAFEDDQFYNLLIEFDSQVGSDDFLQLEKLLINAYGNEYNLHITYEDQKEIFVKDLLWIFYNSEINTFYDSKREMIAKIHLRSCCDEDKPKPLRLSYTYVPISINVLPKRPSQISCPTK